MGFNSIIGSSHTSYGGVDLICMNKGVNTQYLTLTAFDSLAGWRKSIMPNLYPVSITPLEGIG